MRSQPVFAQPPRIAVWLITLFALAEEAESILGDLLEEFSLLAAKSGTHSARDWYWRQTVKTVPRLAGFAFRTAPWMTTTAVVGGLLLRKLVAPLVGGRYLQCLIDTRLSSNITSAHICFSHRQALTLRTSSHSC
jgi:hypothetical protein